MFDAQFDDEIFAIRVSLFDGELGDEGRLVFNLHFEIIGLQEWSGLFKNRQELGGREPVVSVILKPRLQATDCFCAQSSAAVYELLVDTGYFSYVGVWRNFTAGRKNESDVLSLEFVQYFFEFG